MFRVKVGEDILYAIQMSLLLETEVVRTKLFAPKDLECEDHDNAVKGTYYNRFKL